MEVWSHRGRTLPDEFGNSLKSFLTAYNLGVTGIETDISFTIDEEVIIYHPGSTEPNLVRMSWRDIENSIFNVIDLNTFLNLLAACPGIMCCLDIKQYSEELVRKAVEAVVEKGLEDRIYFTAFQKRMPWLTIESDGKLLVLAKEICPRIKTQLIVTWPANLPKLAEKYRPDAMSFGWLQEPSSLRFISKVLFKMNAKRVNLKKQIEEVKQRNIKVWAGIFNDPQDMLYYMDLGVNGIFTDNPRLLFDLIANKKIP